MSTGDVKHPYPKASRPPARGLLFLQGTLVKPDGGLIWFLCLHLFTPHFILFERTRIGFKAVTCEIPWVRALAFCVHCNSDRSCGNHTQSGQKLWCSFFFSRLFRPSFRSQSFQVLLKLYQSTIFEALERLTRPLYSTWHCHSATIQRKIFGGCGY